MTHWILATTPSFVSRGVRRTSIFLASCLFFFALMGPKAASGQISEARTNAYLVETLDVALESLDDQMDRWKERYVALEGGNIVSELIGYQPPSFIVNIADISSYLFKVTGDKKYAETTRDLLVSMNEYTKFFPEAFRTRVEYKDGIPAVNWFRALPIYTEAFERTRNSGVYSAADISAIRDAVESSAEIVFKFPEWGAMNRAMLRAESLIAASLAFPDHPRAGDWKKMATILASDTIGQWEIEDASVYHPIWLYAYVNYVDLANNPRAFESPMLKFYFDYFVALLTPAGTIPDFGDGHWKMSLNEYVVLLERGAKEYQSPEMKWAAMRMLEDMELVQQGRRGGFEPGPALKTPSVGLAQVLVRRAEWGDPDLKPSVPTFLSGDAIDEIISKKIVMRSGWDRDATYLMMNYKDEGYYSVMQKNYLKQNLAVEEEKMHHGQSDENGISVFMKERAVLLSDGGYRPEAPSGPYGAYRADIFHNRVVVRDTRKGVRQPYFEVFRNSGAYNETTRTTKIDFQDFPEFEYARTRIDDPRTGYQGDRVIIRNKKEDYLIVVDALKFYESKYYTSAQLWHTRKIVETGGDWYRMRIDSLMGRYANPGQMDLLLIMPQTAFPNLPQLTSQLATARTKDRGSEKEDRAEQDELAVYQGTSQHYQLGSTETFVSILVPMKSGNAEQIARRFQIIKDDAEGVTVQIDGSTWFGIKTDLDRDIREEDIRPRYDYESGRINYGPFETDADFSYVSTASGAPRYAATNFVRMDIAGETIFDAPASQFFQVWGKSDHVGVAKWRRWDNF